MADKSFTLAIQKYMLDKLNEDGEILDGAELVLFTNEFPPIGKRMVIGDFTVATFDGYAPAVVVFGTAYQDGQDNAKISAPSVQFTMTGNTTPNTVTGWGITNPAGTSLYYAEKLPSPAPMNESGDAVIVQPTLVYGF